MRAGIIPLPMMWTEEDVIWINSAVVPVLIKMTMRLNYIHTKKSKLWIQWREVLKQWVRLNGKQHWRTRTEKKMESTESQLLHAWRFYELSSIRTLSVKYIYIVDEEENARKLIFLKGIFKE